MRSTGLLDLETLGSSATTSLLELAALGHDLGLLVLVRTHAEVLDSLTGVLGTTEEDGVGTGGGAEGKLVESQALTASLGDSGTSSAGEAESGDGHLGNLEHAMFIISTISLQLSLVDLALTEHRQ